ncbi:enoyl reductase-like protein [Rhizomicrobium palustre]|uniref:Enoyl reductase-like protein n=1 Tax=Rhizomicrobium palustre TaxID=189966 RepID=A0A846N341_9PROT|nr:ribonuclease E inhibitor RraB [Rhizomicrobium palustre]NIK89500.1 enoyl reductase-like protein [Rhizomicrobium palustre]
MTWPPDLDGDVFRRLDAAKFDFSKSYKIEFNVEFENWPPPDQAIDKIWQLYPEAQLDKVVDASAPYILISLCHVLTYEFVMGVQKKISDILSEFGGVCDSWGVLH